MKGYTHKGVTCTKGLHALKGVTCMRGLSALMFVSCVKYVVCSRI